MIPSLLTENDSNFIGDEVGSSLPSDTPSENRGNPTGSSFPLDTPYPSESESDTDIEDKLQESKTKLRVVETASDRNGLVWHGMEVKPYHTSCLYNNRYVLAGKTSKTAKTAKNEAEVVEGRKEMYYTTGTSPGAGTLKSPGSGLARDNARH